MARNISTQLLTTGTVTRGWLGVTVQELTPELARSFGARDTRGVLVAEVVPDSPAARAGLQSGDIITEFDGKPVRNPTDVARAVGLAKPGHQARLTVWRDGGTRTLTARLDEAPGIATQARLGLQVAPVTPEVARELQLRSPQGVARAAGHRAAAARADGALRRPDRRAGLTATGATHHPALP